MRILSGLATTLSFALAVVAPSVAQEHQHPAAAPARQAPPITSTAKKLNESYKSNCEPFAVGFETPGRELFDRRDDIVNTIGLKPGMKVADIGAGSGFFSRLMAARVLPTGIVYAVEISRCLINYINKSTKASNLPNIKTVLGTVRSPNLAPRSVDVVFIAESYHHFEYPKEMLQEIKKALKPDGVLMLVDLERIQGVSPPYVLEMVRAGKGTFTDEIRNAGFELVEDIQILELDYVLKFKHREALQQNLPASPR